MASKSRSVIQGFLLLEDSFPHKGIPDGMEFNQIDIP